jgi:predicted nucleotidyltransferase
MRNFLAQLNVSCNMRFTASQQQAIKDSVFAFLPDAKVLLYGSRTDDSKRGGDIDLLVLKSGSFEKSVHLKILAAFYRRIGEQKIDLLIEDPERLSDFAKLVNPQALPL